MLRAAVAVVFLSAQFIALAHGAAFGADLHDHDAAPCKIQMLSAHGAGLSSEPPTGTDVTFRAAGAEFEAANDFRPAPPPRFKTIRGPPPPTALT